MRTRVRLRFFVLTVALVAALMAAPVLCVRAVAAALAQTGEYEGRTISDVQIIIEGPARDPANPCEPTPTTSTTTSARGHAKAAAASSSSSSSAARDQAVESELLSLLHVGPHSVYSTLLIRESLEAL